MKYIMDYKKIFKSRNIRFKILNLLNWVPDITMIKIQYRMKTGRKLNLKNPQRFTEKLQWYKLYYRNPLMKTCSDKYDVRKYVEFKGLSSILNDLYGIYNNVNEINIELLPRSFVLKTTDGGGGNNIILCNNKERFDFESAKKKLNEWQKQKLKKPAGREWCYEGAKSKIICEKLLPRDSRNDLPDYKFFCFNGKVEFLYVMIDYTDNHDNGKMGFYDKKFNKLPFYRNDFKEIDFDLVKPKNFEKMVEYAEILSKDFPHVRVDFYNIDGKIIFGELTFYNASGYVTFSPDQTDFEIGKKFVLKRW